MPLEIKNLAWLKALAPKEYPELGQKLAEALQSIQGATNNLEQQTNTNVGGAPQPPPGIRSLTVAANNGHFQVSINHGNAQFYRTPHYYLVHADNPHFTNPHIVDMGASRNMNLFLGNATRYFGAYTAYEPSQPSAMVYHGGVRPEAVTGGGSVPGPSFATSQGSGTGAAGVAHSGPGPVPYRTVSGVPPIR